MEVLHEALSTVGFVYLSNHGISEELVGGARMKIREEGNSMEIVEEI